MNGGQGSKDDRGQARGRRSLAWEFDSLTVRLAAGIGALVVAPLVFGFYALSEHHFDRTVANQREAVAVQARILETALLHQMMENDSSLMNDILAEIRDQPGVHDAMILNHEGEVRIASDRSRVGEVVSRESPSCIVCHSKQGSERELWTVYADDAEETLRTVRPIENRPQCYACHDPETRINGILILDTSLTELQAGLQRDATLFLTGAAGLGLLLVGGIGLFVRRLVIVRLKSLRRTARSIAAGNLEERASASGPDVIDRLASDFNHMADTVSNLITEVQEQEAQLVSIMDSLDDGLVVLDTKGEIVAANRAFCTRVAMEPEDMRGRSCHDAIGATLPCCGDEGACPATRCHTTGHVQREVYVSAPDENGRSTAEEVHASPVHDEQGNVVQIVEVWRDISERVEEERRLAEIEHMVALGTLASGFSHEVATPLASMLTCAESSIDLIDGLEHDGGGEGEGLSSLRERAEIIREQVLRCRRITQQFLRFSRGIPPAIEPIDLRRVVGTVVGLVGATAREERVVVEVEEGDALPAVRANTEVVQHALLNLLVNAIQSCEGRGGRVVVGFGADEQTVRLRLEDTGCGIPPDSRPHLFHPFHSRKRGGTGLGLFLSRSFVRRFGGDLQLVRSLPGEGSCFELTLLRFEEVAT